jgi:hypothetical protein
VTAGFRGCFCTGAEVGAGLRGRWLSEEAEPCSSAEVTMVVMVALMYGEMDGPMPSSMNGGNAAGASASAGTTGDSRRASRLGE